MDFRRIEVLAVGGDGGDVFGRGESWPNGSGFDAEEVPGQPGGGRLKEGLGDEPAWVWQ
jgi:hypothetical protein